MSEYIFLGEEMKSNRQVLSDGFRIAMAYIGTVVGAGFATGQEILQFFTRFGYSSFWGILISVLLFIIVGRKILLYGSKLNAKSYGVLIDHIFGLASPLVNLYLAISFVLLCGAMFAGAGALFQEQWGIPYFAGAVLTAVLTLLVTLWGVRGVLTINTVIVPALVVFSILVFFHVVHQGHIPVVSLQDTPQEPFPIIRTGITYASFNLILSIGVLAPMGGAVKERKSLYLGSLLGGGILGALLLMGNYSLLQYMPEVFHREIPQLLIVQQMGGFFIAVYGLVVWLEIFTTAVGNLFAVHTIAQEKYKTASILPAAGATAAGLILCGLGFSNIVSWFYPALGIIGFVLSAIILIQSFTDLGAQ
jgi:uncharacterized membrane protein YkvI